MSANISVLRLGAPGYKYLQRYAEVARILSGNPEATGDDGVDWVLALVGQMEIPSLRTYGFMSNDISKLIQKSLDSSSMKGNPVKLSDNELQDIMEKAY